MTRRAVLFDLDDTLFDHRGTSRAALSAIQEAFSAWRVWSLDELERRHGIVLEELHGEVIAGTRSIDRARAERFRRLLAAAGDRGGVSTATAVARRYREAYVTSARPIRGARPLLEAVRTRARIGIVSNNVLSEQEDKLERLGLRSLVDALVVSAEEGVNKPDPAIFATALGRLDCAASEAVMVGDSWASDIVGAVAAGIAVVWFNRDGRPLPAAGVATEIRTLEPAAVIAAILLDGSTEG